MKIYRYILAVLIALLPALWIDNYTLYNPVWWIVVLAWHFGTLFGYIDKD